MLQPNEEGKIEVMLDTGVFVNVRTVAIFVRLSCRRLTEHRLWVQADSRENFAFFPEYFDFGKITRGDAPSRRVVVAVPDQPKLQITAATCDDKFIQVKVQELGRGATAVYQVSTTVQAEIPNGELYTYVELSTNNPAMPKLRVPLSVVVEAPR